MQKRKRRTCGFCASRLNAYGRHSTIARFPTSNARIFVFGYFACIFRRDWAQEGTIEAISPEVQLCQAENTSMVVLGEAGTACPTLKRFWYLRFRMKQCASSPLYGDLPSGNPAKRFRTLLTHLWIQLPSFCPRKSMFGKRKICNFEGLFASFREKFAGCVAPNQMAQKMPKLHFREFFNTLQAVGERTLPASRPA